MMIRCKSSADECILMAITFPPLRHHFRDNNFKIIPRVHEVVQLNRTNCARSFNDIHCNTSQTKTDIITRMEQELNSSLTGLLQSVIRV